jgi:hypothetical protein
MGRRGPKTIGLPLARDLKSNKLEAIQHHFQLFKDALDTMYKFLLSDITTVEITSESESGEIWIYIGDKTSDDSWRVGISGENLNFEKRIAGAWVRQGNVTGS